MSALLGSIVTRKKNNNKRVEKQENEAMLQYKGKLLKKVIT